MVNLIFFIKLFQLLVNNEFTGHKNARNAPYIRAVNNFYSSGYAVQLAVSASGWQFSFCIVCYLN